MNNRLKLQLGIGIGAMVGLSLFSYLIGAAYQEAVQKTEIATRNYAAVIEARLDSTLRRIEGDMFDLASRLPDAVLSLEAVPRYAAEISANLDVHRKNFPEQDGMRIFDANGELLYTNSREAASTANISDRVHFRKARDNPQDALVISDVIVSRITGESTVVIVKPLRDKQGVFRGVLAATLNFQYFQKLLSSVKLGTDGVVAVYRNDTFNQVLRWPDNGKPNQTLPPDSPTRAALADGRKAVTIELASAADGITRIYSYQVSELFPFFVSVGISRGDALAAWKTSSLAAGLSGLFLVGLVFGLLYWLGRVKAENARFSAIVESSNDAIVGRDLALKIVTWNAAAERLFGYSAAEAIGLDVTRLIPPELYGETAHNRAMFMQNKGVRSSETVRISKDGRRIDVAVTRSNIEEADGAVSGVSLIFRDITGRKRAEAAHDALEAQLRESQKMQAIGTLAGGIAHDFNNILAAILGNTKLAREDSAGNASALVSLDEVHKAAIRARDLVQQILSFSRRQSTERKVIALAAVVAESEHFLRATLPSRLTLRVRCAADAPAVLADTTQMQQVIINLVSNAMQAMSEGRGQIDIGLDTVTLDAALGAAYPQLQALCASHPGKTVRLSVSDDGPGMDANTLARIFEPFFTTKPVGEGTGLGLSVVHGIVRVHEGAIVAESAPGKGTTFTIYLPVAAEAATALVLNEAGGGKTSTPAFGLDGGKHILYLDDDDSLVFLVKRFLEHRGYRVSGFSSQSEALAALRADPAAFYLLLTDYNMPGMSGLDVALEARSIRADLPVAITSGFLDETLRQAASAAGVRDLIFKAIDLDEFCAAVQAVAGDTGAS